MSPKARYCFIAAHKQIADFSSEYVKRVILFKTPLKKVGKKRKCQEVSGSSPVTFHYLLQLMGFGTLIRHKFIAEVRDPNRL